MRRKIYSKLLEWKSGNGESALLVEGARRVGKTHIVTEFGKNEYASFIKVNFLEDGPGPIQIVQDYYNDLDMFFNALSALYKVPLHDRDSLIIFDEVQAFPLARQMIKKLVEDGRYDYIETGSLVSIKTKSSGIQIPSEEDGLEMHPMDFEEFLWALGEDTLVPYLRECFDNYRPVGEAVHKKAMSLFRQYMLVGGMPQAVSKYVGTKRFQDADAAKRRILKLYREDIGNWAGEDANRVLNIFESIPAELNRKDKRFKLSSIDKDARMREYEDSFMWLVDGDLINLCLNSNNPEVGLSAYADRPTMKCYMGDTGLLVTHAYSDRGYMDNELYIAILQDRLDINEGMLVENAVAQQLRANGCKLFFYSRGRDDPDGQMEVDFLIRRDLKICPIEVKSSKRSRDHKSLDDFRGRFGKRLGQAFVLHPKDLSAEDGVVYLPLYMAMFL